MVDSNYLSSNFVKREIYKYYSVSVYSNGYVRVVKMFRSLYDSDKSVSVKSKRDSIEYMRGARVRAKRSIFDYILNNAFDYFLTLTFNKKFIDRYNEQKCIHKVRAFLKRYKSYYSSSFAYVAVFEYHKDKALHVHLVVKNILPRHILDSSRYSKTLLSFTAWKWGFSNLKKIKRNRQNDYKVACYMTKYITKGKKYIGFNRYLVSRSINKVLSKFSFYANDDRYNNIIDMIKKRGKKISSYHLLLKYMRDINDNVIVGYVRYYYSSFFKNNYLYNVYYERFKKSVLMF